MALDLNKWGVKDIIEMMKADPNRVNQKDANGWTFLDNIMVECPHKQSCVKEIDSLVASLLTMGAHCTSKSKEFFEERINSYNNPYYEAKYYKDICGTDLNIHPSEITSIVIDNE